MAEGGWDYVHETFCLNLTRSIALLPLICCCDWPMLMEFIYLAVFSCPLNAFWTMPATVILLEEDVWPIINALPFSITPLHCSLSRTLHMSAPQGVIHCFLESSSWTIFLRPFGQHIWECTDSHMKIVFPQLPFQPSPFHPIFFMSKVTDTPTTGSPDLIYLSFHDLRSLLMLWGD